MIPLNRASRKAASAWVLSAWAYKALGAARDASDGASALNRINARAAPPRVGTGVSGDKPEGSLLQPEFLLPKPLNPRLGRRVFYASRQCFVSRRRRNKTPAGRN